MKLALWCFSVFLFSIHQFAQNVFGSSHYIIDGYLDALLFMPIVLPIIYYERAKLWKLTRRTFIELISIITFLSLITEVVMPQFNSHLTGDPWDVFLYFATGIITWYYGIKASKPKRELSDRSSVSINV